jgi:hypothetical protein
MKKELPRMVVLTSSVDVGAPAQLVWHVLTGLEKYPEWNPYFRYAFGIVAAGETVVLGATLHEGFGKPRRGPVRVVTATPGVELRWTSRFLAPGIMDADHRFVLTEVSPTRTTMTQSEKLTGLLPPISPSLLRKIHAKSGEFDRALKARAEELADGQASTTGDLA